MDVRNEQFCEQRYAIKLCFVGHLPYLLDLTPSDFHLLPRLEKVTKTFLWMLSYMKSCRHSSKNRTLGHTCNKMHQTNQTNRVLTNEWNKQIFCTSDAFVTFSEFSSFPIGCTIHSKYDVILKTFPGIGGVIFENF